MCSGDYGGLKVVLLVLADTTSGPGLSVYRASRATGEHASRESSSWSSTLPSTQRDPAAAESLCDSQRK